MGISSGIRSPNPRAKKTFKSFDLAYQSLTSSLTEDRDARYELIVTNEIIGRHLQAGSGTGFVVPELEDLGTIQSWLELIRPVVLRTCNDDDSRLRPFLGGLDQARQHQEGHQSGEEVVHLQTAIQSETTPGL